MSEDNWLMDFHSENVEQNVDRQKIIKAPFSIPGSKARSLEHLLKILPVRNKWVDHFTGTGIVTFNRPKAPKLEVINDRFSAITSFYRCLKDSEKKKQLEAYFNTNVHSREEFYYCKDTWINETDDVIRAAKWLYVVRLSVIGKGHVFARSTNSRFQNYIDSSLKWFEPIHNRLREILIENLDFETCFKDFDSNDCVHYFDPPYIKTSPGIYEFTWDRNDLTRLLRCCREAKGYVALSCYSDEQIDKETFWTNKYKWKVPIRAEVQAFTEQNYKENHRNVQNVDYATECLWVKE